MQEPRDLGGLPGPGHPQGAFPWHSSGRPVEMLVKEVGKG